MSKFNNGRAYHGSREVTGGKLIGSTAETDHFYFICPRCPNKHLLRILDYTTHSELEEHPYKDQVTKPPKRAFVLAFQIYCEECKLLDFVKIGNIGWQGGSLQEVLQRGAA